MQNIDPFEPFLVIPNWPIATMDDYHRAVALAEQKKAKRKHIVRPDGEGEIDKLWLPPKHFQQLYDDAQVTIEEASKVWGYTCTGWEHQCRFNTYPAGGPGCDRLPNPEALN